MKQLIIFDWDDVFSRGSTKGYYACYHEAMLGVGVMLSPEEEDKRIKSEWGKGHREEISALLKERPELAGKACEIYEEHFFGTTFVNNVSVVQGSPALVKRLTKKYVLAIASGAHPQILIERIMPKFGVDPTDFSQIVTAYDIDDSQFAKPHPYSLKLIMRNLNIAPGATIMVGDAANDVRMARSANVEPVVVLSGHLNESEARTMGVSYIIPDVTKLESVLDKM